MIPTGPATKVFLALGTTDLRKGFEGLGDLVRHRLKEDPMSGHLFAFTNRNRTRLKLLFWDGTGLWVAAKRLERGAFQWPRGAEAQRELSAVEWGNLLQGLEVTAKAGWYRLEGKV